VYWCTNPQIDDVSTMYQMMHGLGWEDCLGYLLQYYNESHPLLEEEEDHDRHKIAKMMADAAGDTELLYQLHQQELQHRHSHYESLHPSLHHHGQHQSQVDHHKFSKNQGHRISSVSSSSIATSPQNTTNRKHLGRSDVHVARSTIICQLKQIASSQRMSNDGFDGFYEDNLSTALALLSSKKSSAKKSKL